MISEKFLLQVSGVKEKTKHQYSQYVQKFLCEKFDHFSEDRLVELSPVDVGEAIVAYLKKSRPATPERRVFVRHGHPLGTAVTGSAVGAVIRRSFKRAGRQLPLYGSHILRHTVATHMIQQGVSIKEIADILRHKSIDTTVIYTKVDIPMLSEVALPWPIDSGRVS